MSARRRLAACLLAALALVVAAPRPAAQCVAPGCLELTGDISDANVGPLLTGRVYVIDNSASVPSGATLTIQPGVTLKMDVGTFLVSGTLDAQGTAGQPILMTSYRDDSLGGDTNGDGAATTPAKGDWSGIQFGANAGASVMRHVTMRWASSGSGAAVVLSTSGVTLDQLTILDGGGYAVDANERVVSVTGCHFQNMRGTLRDVHPNGVDDLTGNTGSGNVEGDAIRLYQDSLPAVLTGTPTWSADNMINGTGGIVARADLEIAASATLTWGPGLVLKMDPGHEVRVKGTLRALGDANAPIVVTSVHDDAYGDDTSTAGAAPGDWKYVYVTSSSGLSEFRHVRFRYGGSTAGLLRLNDFAVIDACVFELSASAGLSPSTQKPPLVTNCAFLDNAEEPVAAVPLAALAGFSGNTASGNGSGDVIVLGGGTLDEPATLTPASAFNGTGSFVLEGSVQVGAGGVLSVEPGVVFKAKSGAELRALSGGKLLLGGVGAPVVFTSLQDDAWGGDLNGDGGATQPAPGDWNGVRAVFADDTSVITNVRVRYASANAIALVQTDLVLSDTTVEFASGPGLDGNDASYPTVTGCHFEQCGGLAPVVGFGLDALAAFSGNTASGNAGGDSLRLPGGTLGGDIVVQKANTLNGNGVLVLEGTPTVAQSLTLGAGITLKFDGALSLEVGKTLIALGTEQEPVVLTSFDDDHAGDTNGDGGPASPGTPGSWRGLSFNLQSDACVLTHTWVRNAGFNDEPSVLHVNGDATLDHVRVERGAATALRVQSGEPTVSDCVFTDHLRPVELTQLKQLAGFSDNSASGNTQHDDVVIQGQGSPQPGGYQLLREHTLDGTGVLRMHASATVSTGQSMQIGPGMVLKFNAPSRFLAVSHGTLVAQGTALDPVVFTSIHDDDFGGVDDVPTAPAPGDWLGLRFTSAQPGTLVEHALIRYAGAGGEPSVVLDDSSPTFCFVDIELGAGPGVSITGNSSPVLKNVSIDDNAGEPLLGVTWNVLAGLQGLTASGNGGVLDTVVIDSPEVKGHLRIEQENVYGSCIVVNVSPDTHADDTLSFGRGLVIKAGQPDVELRVLEVQGTGLEKTVFTSIHDDEWGGDTNANGAATSPAPGDWIGVSCTTAGGTVFSGASVDHALVRWAGAVGGNAPAPTGLFAGTALSTRVEFSAGHGFDGNTAENVIAFANAGIGIQSPLALNCTASGNAELGIRAKRSVYCVSWHNGPTGVENFFEVSGPIIGCPTCAADIVYCIGSDLGVSPPVQGGPSLFGCPNTGWGNAFVDPLFVDEFGGDLRLSANSPARDYVLQPCPASILADDEICTPWGLTGGGYPEDPAGSRDHRENSRRIDGSNAQTAGKLADLGALERVHWSFEVTGPFVMGQPITIEVQGPPGSATLMIGFASAPEDDLFLYGWGYLMITPQFLKLLATFPTNVPINVGIPVDPSLEGLQGAVQCTVSQPGRKQFSNVYRPRFRF